MGDYPRFKVYKDVTEEQVAFYETFGLEYEDFTEELSYLSTEVKLIDWKSKEIFNYLSEGKHRDAWRYIKKHSYKYLDYLKDGYGVYFLTLKGVVNFLNEIVNTESSDDVEGYFLDTSNYELIFNLAGIIRVVVDIFSDKHTLGFDIDTVVIAIQWC